MALGHTHTAHGEQGGDAPVRLHELCCEECGNAWFVRTPQEFVPLFCCYCGIKFFSYTDDDGVLRDLAGRPARLLDK